MVREKTVTLERRLTRMARVDAHATFRRHVVSMSRKARYSNSDFDWARRLLERSPDGAGFESAAGGVPPGVKLVRDGAAASDYGLASGGLEAIIKAERPSLRIIDGVYETAGLPTHWLDTFDLGDSPAKLKTAIKGVGRVDDWVTFGRAHQGTSFVVGEDLVLTNRHVAEHFVLGYGLHGLTAYPSRNVGVDFIFEFNNPGDDYVNEGIEVLLMHPIYDAALLRVPGAHEGHGILRLCRARPSVLMSREVALIGYPARNYSQSQKLQDEIFGEGEENYRIKRLAPGLVVDNREHKAFYAPGEVEVLCHDASTLSGNSGSAVVDVESGAVLGLHFGGFEAQENFAVPSWVLASDPRFEALGVTFTDEVEAADDTALIATPDLGALWSAADPGVEPAPSPESTPAELSSPGADTQVETLSVVEDEDEGETTVEEEPTPAPDFGGLDPHTWFENLDESTLWQQLLDEPEVTRARLVVALGQGGAEEMIRDLGALANEGAGGFEVLIPPPAVELVLVHGFMGCHLVNTVGLAGPVWLNAARLIDGSLARDLRLDAHARADGPRRVRLSAGRLLKSKYGRAVGAWGRANFVVHEFSYDWRKSLTLAADELQALVTNLRRERPERRLAIVAHSSGGAVAAVWASRHPDWADSLEHVVLVGAPLGGWLLPVQAALGELPLFRQLASLSVVNELDALRETACSWPGLIELLPSAELFPGTEGLLQRRGWRGAIAPSQGLLQVARVARMLIDESPLLPAAIGIVSASHGTPSSLESLDGQLVVGPAKEAGDGLVPVSSAAHTRLGQLVRVGGGAGATEPARHVDLMRDRRVIDAVAKLVRGRASRLEAYSREQAIAAEVNPAAGHEATSSARDMSALADNIRARRATVGELDQLL